MTAKRTCVTAGLVFLGYRNLDIANATSRAAAVLETLDERITGIRAVSGNEAVVTGQHHRVHLSIREDVKVPTLRMAAELVLDITVKTLSEGDASPYEAATVLARITKALHMSLSPDHVQWIETAAVLSSADFVLATSQPDRTGHRHPAGPVKPRRRAAPLPAIETTHEVLQRRFVTEAEAATAAFAARSIPRIGDFEWTLDGIIADMPDKGVAPIEDIRDESNAFRLSAWLLSIAVACLALPVGVALILVNLVKGENLRLASQTAALTGTFVTFNLHGATAETLAFVQAMLG